MHCTKRKNAKSHIKKKMKGVEGDLRTNFLSRGPSRDAVLSGCIVSVDLCVCWCCGSIFIYGSRVFLGSVCVTPEQLRPWGRGFSPLWSVFLSVVFQSEWGNAGAPPQSRPRNCTLWMCGEPVNAHEDHRGPAVVPDAFALTDERATAVAGEENAETAAARILQPTWAMGWL